MKYLVKSLLFLAAAFILSQAPQNTAQTKVKVKKITVKSNYGTSVHVAVGKKVKLTTTVKVSPNYSANRKVSYKSSNKKIATVSASGYVKGIQTGKCRVTVTSKKNSKKKRNRKSWLMVSEKPSPIILSHCADQPGMLRSMYGHFLPFLPNQVRFVEALYISRLLLQNLRQQKLYRYHR